MVYNNKHLLFVHVTYGSQDDRNSAPRCTRVTGLLFLSSHSGTQAEGAAPIETISGQGAKIQEQD